MALENLLLGMSIALTPPNLFWCFVGVLLGTVVGILPGMGSPATVAMLLPLTAGMNPATALIMMSGIFYGAKYGGSTTSILLNLPGEPSSVVTCIDGYQMARQGRAGPALGIAAIASFVAGTFGVAGLMLAAPPLAQFALQFGPPEYFGLMLIGLTLVVFLAEGSILKGLLSCVLGLLLSLVGTDLFTAESRFTFGRVELLDGIDVIVASVGIFALGEILVNVEQGLSTAMLRVPKGFRNLLPSRQDLKDSRFAFVNGSVVGFLAGTIPGGGATIASFLAYGLEKAVSRRREKFGTGVVEGVAAPEAANNSETGGALVPLLTLGIPSSSTTAILLAGLTVWGLRPGPLLIQENPDLFWGLVASMYIGNIMLLILNLPLVPLFAQIMRLPAYVMYPLVAGISMVGVYNVANSIFDIWMLVGFGLLGYAMRRLGFPAAPLILGLVLGNRLELTLRQSMTMSQGNVTIFFTRWLSAAMIIAAIVLLSIPVVRGVRQITASFRLEPKDGDSL
jgi:putative tricarboxylic transport membrane protein